MAYDVDDMKVAAETAVKWQLDNTPGVDLDTLVDVAEQGARDDVDASLIWTQGIYDTWVALGRPDYPVEDLDWPDDGDIDNMILVATQYELIYGEDRPDYVELVLEVLGERAETVAENHGDSDDLVPDGSDVDELLDYVLERGDYSDAARAGWGLSV